MAKVITDSSRLRSPKQDEKLVEKFLTRGVEGIYPGKEELKKKLMSGERLKIYQGFDPTGPFLHVGHAIGIRALRILQELGHEVIFLVGDYTARVGDPDKDTTREMLSDSDIEKNMKGWKKQAGQLIDFSGSNAVKFKNNYAWLSKLKLNDLIRLMSNMTVQQMMERDLFARRLKNGDPIKLHEFIYPLLQGYDGVAMEVDMEIGGADQIFNMLVGRSLTKAYLNKEKFIRVNKMMDAPDGRTMSKTKGNGINLSDTAEEMYGKAMSYSDSHILSGLELLTDVPLAEISEIGSQIKAGANPMNFKKRMAFEIVKAIKGEKAAAQAEEYFQKTVQNKETPDEVQTVKTSNKNIIGVLVETGLASSNSEARRLIEQGGVKSNGQVITDPNFVLHSGEHLIQKGKRFFVKVVID